MARITRAVQKIFGSTAGASDIAQIGSLRNGEIVYTTDPVTLQGLSLYLTGLKGIVSSDKYIPALEDINGIYFLFSRQLAYLMQEGIAEWDASTEYHIGSKAKAPGTGNVYTSLTNNNTGNETADTNHWTDAVITDTVSEKNPGAGVTVDGLNIKDNGINGSTIIKNDLQLTGSTADGFANQTTLYIWNFDSNSSEAQVDVVGGKSLAVAAGALTAGADVLGNSKYCAFDGSTYLSSDDAAFNFTGDFSIGFWAYSSTWSPANTCYLISRQASAGNADGWHIAIQGGNSGTLAFYTRSGGEYTSMTTGNIAGLTSSSWHHFVITREAGVSQKIYIDGVLSVVNNDTSDGITADGNLEICSWKGGQAKFTGRMDEAFIHKDTVLTADEVRNIYARSAKKFAVKAQDNTVFIQSDVVTKTGLVVDVDETKFSHKMPVVINGTTYYIMLTAT